MHKQINHLFKKIQKVRKMLNIFFLSWNKQLCKYQLRNNFTGFIMNLTISQVAVEPCHVMKVTVIEGRNISKGSLHDLSELLLFNFQAFRLKTLRDVRGSEAF